MGQVTPNIGIYLPAAGETNYDAAFASGMMNVDLHDHSGPPNKGVPLSGSGLSAGAVTFDKLAANVADNTTGIGTHTGGLANQLYLLGSVASLFQLSPATGFVAISGSALSALTFQPTASIGWNNADGSAGNPSAFLIKANVNQGGTGLLTLSPYDILLGGTTATGNLQQVAGEGTAGQVLTSQGPSAIPIWEDNNVLSNTVTLTNNQMLNLFTVPVQLVPAPGAGTSIVLKDCTCYLTVVSPYSGSTSPTLYYGSAASLAAGLGFTGLYFLNASSSYIGASGFIGFGMGSGTYNIQNKGIYLSNSSADFTGGDPGNSATFVTEYSIISL